MRKMKWILTVVAILIMSVGFANSNKEADIKKCEITSIDVFVNKNIKAIWTLDYNGEESPITVVKHKNINGIQYVVHSKYFDVTYASTETGFGTVDMKKSCVMVHKKISKAVINKNEWKKQRILTPNKISDDTAVGLISSYLPHLINDGYTHILN